MKEKPETYGPITRTLHWTSAALILTSLVFGYLMVNIVPEGQQAKMYPGHVLFGWIILALMLVRLGWRFVERWPDPPPGLSPLREKVFKWNHILLYVFVILMLSSGLGILSFSGLGLLPGGVTPEAIQDVSPRFAHNILSKIVFVLILMHLGGILQYQFTKGDSLARMGLKLKKNS